MKTLSCKDMGVVDCEFVTRGSTAEDVKTMLTEHALAKHADKMAGADLASMDAMMMAKMQDMV
ncbi:MAG: DUF1059 domain-containing protein [Patescibacteria group bacterium]|jgi:predicted small metal-binding protein